MTGHSTPLCSLFASTLFCYQLQPFPVSQSTQNITRYSTQFLAPSYTPVFNAINSCYSPEHPFICDPMVNSSAFYFTLSEPSNGSPVLKTVWGPWGQHDCVTVTWHIFDPHSWVQTSVAVISKNIPANRCVYFHWQPPNANSCLLCLLPPVLWSKYSSSF